MRLLLSEQVAAPVARDPLDRRSRIDRKSTRLNSSHSQISYAVFCLKKKHETSITLPHLVYPTINWPICAPYRVSTSHSSEIPIRCVAYAPRLLPGACICQPTNVSLS